jgi:aminopeptidase N
VRLLRGHQFVEDAGPLAHPVRPEIYHEINNFYTATVYEKGAEVVRMIKTLLGPDAFRTGMDLYFERHDGQAATIEQFVQCFADVSEKISRNSCAGIRKPARRKSPQTANTMPPPKATGST